MIPHVEKETRQRGFVDTRPLGHVIALCASLLLHILPLPMYLLGGMLNWIGNRPDELPDHETIIPIDLMLSEGMDKSEGVEEPSIISPPPVATDPEAIPSALTPVAKDAGLPEQADGGPDAQRVDADVKDGADDATLDVNDASDEQPDVHPEVAPQSEAGSDVLLVDVFSNPSLDAAIARVEQRDGSAVAVSVDAGVGESGAATKGDAGFRAIRDPVRSSGDVRKIAPKNPNVSLLIYPSRIRGHQLAVQFAPTLTKLRNWRRFFGGTGLDPIRDSDWILIAGPQLRDSSRVVAVLRYNVPQHRVRAAIDGMVKRSGARGAWVPGKVPAAKAFVDGAERYFVMPGPNILVVVPPDGLEQARNLPRNLSFPSRGNEVVVLFLKHPANAFRDQPVKLPTSVQSMRFSMSLNPNGGADARLDAKDMDATSAAKNAPELTEVINKAMEIDLIFAKRRLLNHVTFRADGDHIRTETHVTDAQLRHILSFIAARIEQVDGPRRSVGVTPQK